MLLLVGLSCSSPAPEGPVGPLVEPGAYPFYDGAFPRCGEQADPPQVVRLEKRTPVRSTVLTRSGRYLRVEHRGKPGWIATEDPDDSRIITALSNDEPDATCLQAALTAFGEQRWLVRTAKWLSIVDVTTSRVRHLSPASGGLARCRTADGHVLCQGPSGPVKLDSDGVVVNGKYEPSWARELYPEPTSP